MPRTLTDVQVGQLKQTYEALGALINSIEGGEPHNQAAAATPLPREPQWVAEAKKAWTFLKAVEEAGGRLRPEQLSIIARKNGYDPRGLGGFYTGNGSLRRDDPYRVLTEVGRRYVRQWEPEFGDA